MRFQGVSGLQKASGALLGVLGAFQGSLGQFRSLMSESGGLTGFQRDTRVSLELFRGSQERFRGSQGHFRQWVAGRLMSVHGVSGAFQGSKGAPGTGSLMSVLGDLREYLEVSEAFKGISGGFRGF